MIWRGVLPERAIALGEAALPLQPLTGAGLFKAWHNARTLAAASVADAPLESTFAGCAERESALGERLLATGLELEDAFVRAPIVLATAGAEAVRAWWARRVRFPPDYSYLAPAEARASEGAAGAPSGRGARSRPRSR